MNFSSVFDRRAIGGLIMLPPMAVASNEIEVPGAGTSNARAAANRKNRQQTLTMT
jgi:hypothetical protein